MEVISYNANGQNTPISGALTVVTNNSNSSSTTTPFIEANTEATTLHELKNEHITPSFIDAEAMISHSDFIEVAASVVNDHFRAERILNPNIRVSHKVLGRVPAAKHKAVEELESWEKTTFYNKMMFVIEIPSVCDVIDGQNLSLMIGGVRVYENLNQRKGVDECFKLCCGYSVKICCNLMVSVNGLAKEIKVKSLQQLEEAIFELVSSYDAITDLVQFQQLQNYSLTESQFARLLGRCKMYSFLPTNLKKDLPELQFGETQLNTVCRDYFKSQSFCRGANGDINLFKVHNLFTQANKSSYIDSFLPRSANASSFVGELANALEHKTTNWFLS